MKRDSTAFMKQGCSSYFRSRRVKVYRELVRGCVPTRRLHMETFTHDFKRCGHKRLGRCFVGLMFCLLVLGRTTMLYGQVAQQLLGRVTDASGAVVPNATVTVTNEGTAVATTTHTSQTGDWVVPYLSPGSYAVKIESAGFKIETQTGIKLDVGQLRSVDIQLSVGTVGERVTVTANTLALDTISADRGGV